MPSSQVSSRNSAISAVSRSGARRSSKIESRLDEPGVLELAGEMVGVGEGMDEVDLVPDHERGRRDGAAGLVGRGDGPDEHAVQHRRDLLGLGRDHR